MDGFGYWAASAYAVNAGNIAERAPFALERDELAEVLQEARRRFGRRRLFRTGELREIVEGVRGAPIAPNTPETIDRAMPATIRRQLVIDMKKW